MKRTLILFLFSFVVWAFVGCTQDAVSLIDTEWTCHNPQVDGSESVVLTFHVQSLCTVRRTQLQNGTAVEARTTIGYRYTTPKVVLVAPDGQQAWGVFYDGYTRLELRWGASEATFYKTR